MRSTNQDIDRILAVGRLYEFSSNKRFHLIKNEFISDHIGQKALELNNEIKNTRGIDIFEAREDKDLLEYQNILNSFTTIISNQTFGIRDIADELQLLESQCQFSKEKWRSFSIDVDEP